MEINTSQDSPAKKNKSAELRVEMTGRKLSRTV
jgi:hypothetical protein